MRSILAGVLLAGLAAVGTPSAAAQMGVTAADIQRLQDAVAALNGEFTQLQQRDPAAASALESEVAGLREEVIYLRVKLRKGLLSDRSEYEDLRDRIDDMRSRVTAQLDPGTMASPKTAAPASTSTPAQSSPPAASTSPATASGSGGSAIPVGQELDVRLQDTLSSGTNQVEDRFIATTVVPLSVNGRELIPAGSEVRGVVSAVDSAGRLDRKARMSLTFDQITINGKSYPMRGTLVEALEGGGYKKDAGRIGTGAGVGAIIGGILGGFKGALAGILIGGGGVVAATEGREVELPAGTVLRLRLDSPPAIR
ncbi:MAG TPA: hypothetical protein VNK41_01965 [Vicinamibacterales bacterium]|nr:hypothetical protein [Vicinamibacterales bacterium]